MLVVQKYGGTSVGDAERIKNVARRLAARRERGDQVVAVVSAMGDTTDNLTRLAHAVSADPTPREMDLLLSTGETVSITLLAMALRDLGADALSLTGAQAGIRTDASHRRARILAVEPQRLRAELERGRIVIVAGFQGMSEAGDVTTLGRGASDLSAVAVAAGLGATVCEIYSDVDGIFTADPRVVPEARRLKDIGYDEMLELAAHGARVMHPRAVELGELYRLPILVASSFHDRPGTLIHEEAIMENRNKVRGVAHDLDVAKITVLGVPDRPGIAADLFEPLAEAGVSVDTIVQNASVHKLADLSFTVGRADLDKALRVVGPVGYRLGAADCVADDRLGKVSIVGTGMQSAPGYAARMFRALHAAGINIEMISTSEIRITCIIHQDRVEDAARALHTAFELETGD
jgi:aspartate kinase